MFYVCHQITVVMCQQCHITSPAVARSSHACRVMPEFQGCTMCLQHTLQYGI
jgi:hypothetical protein